MQEWINQTLESETLSLAALPAVFLLGLVSSVASVCCSAPIFGAIVGYSGSREGNSRRATLLTAFFFMLGIVITIIILGSVVGLIGQAAQSTLQRGWRLFAGLIFIFFGLASLKLLPFELPSRISKSNAQMGGLLGAGVLGIAMGGAVSICSMCCNPGLLIVLGIVIVKGYNLWTIAILSGYAIGFSLPLAALVLGVSFGKMAAKAKRAETIIRIAAGVVLIATGFYFLATL